MNGFFLSISAGLMSLIHNDQSKFLRNKLDTRTTALATSLAFTMVSLIILVIFYLTGAKLTITGTFWINAIFAALILTVASLFLLKGIKNVPLSRALPLLAVGPVVTLLFSGNADSSESIGVVLVAVAMFVFRLEPGQAKSKLFHKGQIYILLTGILFGLTPIFDKNAVINSSPILYSTIAGCLRLVLLTIAFFAIGKFSRERSSTSLRPLIPVVALIAALQVAEWLFQMSALKSLSPAIVVAIKEAMIILGALIYGNLFRHEKISVWAIIGTILAALGVLLIRLT